MPYRTPLSTNFRLGIAVLLSCFPSNTKTNLPRRRHQHLGERRAKQHQTQLQVPTGEHQTRHYPTENQNTGSWRRTVGSARCPLYLFYSIPPLIWAPPQVSTDTNTAKIKDTNGCVRVQVSLARDNLHRAHGKHSQDGAELAVPRISPPCFFALMWTRSAPMTTLHNSSTNLTFFGPLISVAATLTTTTTTTVLHFSPLPDRTVPAVVPAASAASATTTTTVGTHVWELLSDPAVHDCADLRNVVVLVDLRAKKWYDKAPAIEGAGRARRQKLSKDKRPPSNTLYTCAAVERVGNSRKAHQIR